MNFMKSLAQHFPEALNSIISDYASESLESMFHKKALVNDELDQLFWMLFTYKLKMRIKNTTIFEIIKKRDTVGYCANCEYIIIPDQHYTGFTCRCIEGGWNLQTMERAHLDENCPKLYGYTSPYGVRICAWRLRKILRL
jgi:hypothetical protein